MPTTAAPYTGLPSAAPLATALAVAKATYNEQPWSPGQLMLWLPAADRLGHALQVAFPHVSIERDWNLAQLFTAAHTIATTQEPERSDLDFHLAQDAYWLASFALRDRAILSPATSLIDALARVEMLQAEARSGCEIRPERVREVCFRILDDYSSIATWHRAAESEE